MTKGCDPAAILFVVLLGACGQAPPASRPEPRSLDYIDWSADRAWRLEDLPSVVAALDQLCLRVEVGYTAARADADVMATDLWVVREHLLPLLRALPDAEGVPGDAMPAGTCRSDPDAALVEAVAAMGDDAAGWPDRAHALVALETGEGGRGVADDVRLVRVLLALRPIATADRPGPSEALATAAALLECPPGAPAPDPAALWERLAVEAKDAAEGSEALDLATLGPEARDVLARQGFLLRVARALRPVIEDPDSNLRGLAADLLERLIAAWGSRAGQ